MEVLVQEQSVTGTPTTCSHSSFIFRCSCVFIFRYCAYQGRKKRNKDKGIKSSAQRGRKMLLLRLAPSPVMFKNEIK
jgi:hypothetical protein